MIFNRIGSSFKGKLDGDPSQTQLKIMITHMLRECPHSSMYTARRNMK
jgi:hypothetical protein